MARQVGERKIGGKMQTKYLDYDSALMTVIEGTTPEHLDMIGSEVIQRLLADKWKAFAAVSGERLRVAVLSLVCSAKCTSGSRCLSSTSFACVSSSICGHKSQTTCISSIRTPPIGCERCLRCSRSAAACGLFSASRYDKGDKFIVIKDILIFDCKTSGGRRVIEHAGA